MEILKRAKGNAGEIIPWNVPESELRDEINHRTAKAGYTTGYGEPVRSGKIRSMPANKKYRENYVKIFGHE